MNCYTEGMAKKTFQIPDSFLSQLNEFSQGFLLITINDKREFEVYHKTDGMADYMGLVNFADIVSQQLQENLRTNESLDLDSDNEEGEEE